ncbi:prepilin peptidase [Conservatibacter flavescens]|nr:A24 family peptidase [Conservatibacter flavescens]
MTFSARLMDDIQQSYQEIFPQMPPHFYALQATLSPIKCGHFFTYFFSGGSVFLLLFLGIDDWQLALLCGIYCCLLYSIATVDWHYQLISPTVCRLLLSLGLLSAWYQISPLSLDAVMTSVSIGFTSFYGLYYLSKWYYQYEALGRGDYWLMGGLSSFVAWQYLPLLVLVACISGLLYVGVNAIKGRKVTSIPFAPFLCFAGLIMGLWSLLHPTQLA